MTELPGNISSNETATGLLVRGLSINGDYLIVDNCTLFPVQEVDEKYFIQGGPRGAIADIGNRHVEGQITCPIRVDEDYKLEPAIEHLLDNAQNPDTALVIHTNHVLSHLGITADSWGTDDNKYVNLDCCTIKDLVLSVTEDEGVKLVVSIVGMIDTTSETELVEPPDDYLIHRTLSFADCDVSREESDMRTVNKLEIRIVNNTEMPKFLMAMNAEPSDQPFCIGTSSTKWQGSFEETLRKGVEAETFIHGGFMYNENLVFCFGPLKATIKYPMFKIGEQPLTSTTLIRKTEFFAQMLPTLRNIAGDLFSYI